MKKSALLAVSALSLGVVGLATFTPVVSAVTSSGNATITANVQGSLGVGVDDVTGGAQSLDVTFDTMNANDMKTKSSTISTTNNTGTAATLTVKDTDDNASLVSGDDSIPTGTTIAKGTSNWGISVNNDSTYAAMPISTAAGLPIGSDEAATAKDFSVTYGVSTNATQAEGIYTDEVTYTFTQ